MPRKLASLSFMVALGSAAIALLVLALSAAAAPPLTAPDGPESGLHLDVNYSHDWVNASTGLNEIAAVNIKVRRNGAVIATIDGNTGGDGNYSSNQHQSDWSPMQPDLMLGDTVEATTSGGSASVNGIGEITGAIDMDTDSVSGTIRAPGLAPGNVRVWCEVWVQDVNVPFIEQLDVPANGGSYSCDFFTTRSYHISPGDNLAVSYFDLEGDRVIAVFRAPAPDLGVNVRTEGNSDAGEDGVSVFRVDYENRGDMPAANVILTQTLPAGTSFVTSTLELDMNPVVTEDTMDTVRWNLGTVSPGGKRNFLVVLGNTLDVPSSFTTAVDISTSSPGDDLGNNHWQTLVSIVSGRPDLNVGQQVQPYNPLSGDTYRIEVNYGNNGPVPAGPVTLNVDLDPRTILGPWAFDNGFGPLWKLTSNAGGHVVFEAPAVPGRWGGRLLLTVEIPSSVPADEQLFSTVEISGPLDSDTSNNGPWTQDVRTTGDARPDLGVDKSWGNGQLVPGGHAYYNLNYSNDGNVTQPSVRLTDTLPSGTTFVTSTVDLGWGESQAMTPVDVSGGMVAWDLGATGARTTGQFQSGAGAG